MKVNAVENLISFGIEDDIFGPTKVRVHFPKDELPLGKKRLLGVVRLVV